MARPDGAGASPDPVLTLGDLSGPYSDRTEEGWRTDRGCTLLKYGPLASIESHLFDRDLAPHETWAYNNIPGEGQVSFVFADRDGFGTFELIHATVAGERKLANWQDELQR